ncbi:winged helix-turn-helix transcriptional regulator [Devosia sp. MC532]|uniref:ArsR/SmtB family transcription factor n=1 Tax=Devosia sp. MC532 TaxID=2799788 RepID=UPI0018F643B9|nr:metalloregulator ArsR/SmtB family transcription factor [Devosia sp. MC532]MBJ7578067.1 winged helix-turn-helix transcriptional regulator [Devosia sp. MC532]
MFHRNSPIKQSPMRDDDIANMMRALGHPVRLEILRIMASQQQGECCCGDVTDSLTLAQSTVSQHIKVLLDVGLIERRPHGTRNRYCIRHDTLADLNSAFGGLLQGLLPLTATKEAEPA